MTRIEELEREIELTKQLIELRRELEDVPTSPRPYFPYVGDPLPQPYVGPHIWYSGWYGGTSGGNV